VLEHEDLVRPAASMGRGGTGVDVPEADAEVIPFTRKPPTAELASADP